MSLFSLWVCCEVLSAGSSPAALLSKADLIFPPVMFVDLYFLTVNKTFLGISLFHSHAILAQSSGCDTSRRFVLHLTTSPLIKEVRRGSVLKTLHLKGSLQQ